jgi:SAM-dependent methyltransferase
VSYHAGPTADFTRLAHLDGTFDVVSCISVLEQLPPDAQLAGAREMARVLKPGGRLIITYDKYVDLTAALIAATGLTPSAIVEFRPSDLPRQRVDVVGLCLLKEPA